MSMPAEEQSAGRGTPITARALAAPWLRNAAFCAPSPSSWIGWYPAFTDMVLTLADRLHRDAEPLFYIC
jgi:hypothetical protein